MHTQLELPCDVMCLMPGQEPYRAIQLEVNETELRDPALVDEVARTIFKYNEAYRKVSLAASAYFQSHKFPDIETNKLQSCCDL